MIRSCLLLALLALVFPLARATTVFNETFTGGSTINSNPPNPAATSPNAIAYQQLAAKTFNPNPPTLGASGLRFGIVGTTSGFNHIQALFTNHPVTLADTGDYLELTVTFTTEGGIITPQTNSTLFFGLHHANGGPDSFGRPLGAAEKTHWATPVRAMTNSSRAASS